MSTMGCSILIMSAAALVVGFIPILGWITPVIALPLAIVAAVVSALTARKPTAQSADKAAFWLAVALVGKILLRMVMF